MRPPRSFTRLRYDAKSPGKIQLPVPPDTVVETDSDFAAALQVADGHFRVVDEPEPAADDEPAGEEPAKSPRAKSRK